MVEVLVAAVLLIVGILASLAIVDRGAVATGNSIQRDGANAIAEELIERATAARYDARYNDMTDYRATSAQLDAGVLTGTPATRFSQALDPDRALADPAIGESDPAHPWLSTSSWNVRRGNTTYRLSYRACTTSDIIDRAQIAGPYDCGRGAGPTDGTGTDGANKCQVGFIDPSTIYGSSRPLDVRIQLLNLGLQLCLSSVPVLGPITDSLCSLLNNSSNGTFGNLLRALTNPGGLLATLQSALGLGLIGANAPLCPTAVESDLTAALGGVATSTKLDIRIAWGTGNGQQLHQTAVIRRATTAAGA